MVEDPTQLQLFNLGAYDEPGTLTREEYRRYRYTLADPPPTWAGRRYEDVETTGEQL
jgi:hypothetical protein